MAHRRHLLAALYAVAVATLLTGCDFSEPALRWDYVYVQKEDASVLKRPIKHHVRLDLKGTTLTWREKAIGSDGQSLIDSFEIQNCKVFDQRNYWCSKSHFESDVIVIDFFAKVENGQLESYQEGETRNFKRKLVVFGLSL
jgi:hypothetical protein